MKLPKNIRQIGEVEEGKKVYVEDYVMTYVRQLAEKGGEDYKAAVLLGQAEWYNNSRHLFIYGAVEIQGFHMESDTVFSNEIWSDVYDKIKTYFEEVEVVGWLFAKPGQEFRIDDRLRKVHLDNFSGQDKVFMIYDSAEKEESFFVYTGNHFKRLKGYYIYYEKNEGMQSFMIDGKQTKVSENEVEEQAIKDIRKKMTNKKAEQHSKKYSQYMYGIGTVVAAIVLIIGTSMLNSQSKMKDLEDTLNVISDNLSSDGTGEEDGSKVTVETINGDIKKETEEWVEATDLPKEEETDVSQEGEDKDGNTPQENDGNDLTENTGEGMKTEEPPQTETQAEAENPPSDSDVVQTEHKEDNAEVNSKKNPKKKEEDAKRETNTQPYDYYIVRKGDTLSQISENIFQSIHYVDQIKNLNQLSDNDFIYEGQKLMIPKTQ